MKSIFTLLFASVLAQLTFSQINPVQNLLWDYEYLGLDGENFSLSWDEPENPHDELLGYNIYRNNELYRFQVENILFCFAEADCNDDNGFPFFEDGQSFYAHVTAVYVGEIESEYIDSAYVDKPLLNTDEIRTTNLKLFPNPVADILKFNEELSHISLFDAKGIRVIFVEKFVDELNVSNLPSGIYLLKAKTTLGDSFEKKFIKK